MIKPTFASLLFLSIAMAVLAGCGGSSSSSTPAVPPAPLDASRINLVFVLSPDLAFGAAGDVNPNTANLTGQGLQRSLLMATYLQQKVLGGANVTSIYAIEPTTHPQTANHYPDMASIENIQQFAMLNQITMSTGPGTPTASAYSYPINASYSSGSVPSGVATPSPTVPCAACQGLDFNDVGGDNEALVNSIIKANVPGYYVFSAPWETIGALLANINKANGYNLSVPTTYPGPNAVYAVSVEPKSSTAAPIGGSPAILVNYDANLSPTSAYPTLPAGPLTPTACNQQQPFRITVTGGASDGARVPSGVNSNETLHIIRHADAHPTNYFADGNFIGPGQWRSLGLPNALRGKIHPTQVFSGDPSQITQGTLSSSGDYFSNIAPAMTAIPYAIANNLPYKLVSSFWITNPDAATLAQSTSAYFFSTGQLNNQIALLAWSYAQIPLAINALIASYYPGGVVPAAKQAPAWPATDYDTIWTVNLDAGGNLTVDNSMCEGIDSAALPVTAPRF